MSSDEDRAREMAEELVTVVETADVTIIAIGNVHVSEWIARSHAEDRAEAIRGPVAAALLAAMREAVVSAVAQAMGAVELPKRPASEERETDIRGRWGTWMYPTTQEKQHDDVRDLLALLDHEREQSRLLEARLLHLMQDSEAYVAGLERGRAEENEACARLAEELAEGGLNGWKVANAVRRRAGR